MSLGVGVWVLGSSWLCSSHTNAEQVIKQKALCSWAGLARAFNPIITPQATKVHTALAACWVQPQVCFQALTNNYCLPIPSNSVGLWTDHLSCQNPPRISATMLTFFSIPKAQLKYTHRGLGIELLTVQPGTGRVLQTHIAQKPSTTGTNQVTTELVVWHYLPDPLGRERMLRGTGLCPSNSSPYGRITYGCLLGQWLSGLIYV